MSESKKPAGKSGAGGQKGGFGLGLVVGLLLGLAIALAVALYVTKVPIPFVDKTPQRNAELDAADANGAKNWDPNAALNVGKPHAAASGVVAAPAAVRPATAVASAPAPAAATAASAATAGAAAPTQAASASRATGADPFVYFVQAGAFTKPEEAEQQRARLGLQGFNAKVYEREFSGRVVYRVRIGPFDGKADAEALHAQVQQAGMESAVVKAQR
jgi:cell division protein FtsN